jgi:transcriptional regulator of acetoin/glycerol metabolism
MSWCELLEMIEDEVGRVAASRIEERARHEFGGMRIHISKRQIITLDKIDEVAPGKPKEAARALGVHPTTIYRTLQRGRLVR